MRVRLDLSVLRKTKWHEYAVRFVFGGAVTVIAGLLTNKFGPTFGGLFLAFPAIFPAGATLVEKHETEKKRRAGIAVTSRGQQAAALDAYGAAMGCVGLGCFALTIWRLLPRYSTPLVFVLAVAAWLAANVLLWRLRKTRHARRSH